MPTPYDAPYKQRQREGIPPKHTKWSIEERASMFVAHRESMVMRAQKVYLSGRARKSFLPGGVVWWPELAPLRPLERKDVRAAMRRHR